MIYQSPPDHLCRHLFNLLCVEWISTSVIVTHLLSWFLYWTINQSFRSRFHCITFCFWKQFNFGATPKMECADIVFSMYIRKYPYWYLTANIFDCGRYHGNCRSLLMKLLSYTLKFMISRNSNHFVAIRTCQQ